MTCHLRGEAVSAGINNLRVCYPVSIGAVGGMRSKHIISLVVSGNYLFARSSKGPRARHKLRHVLLCGDATTIYNRI
jgi:hypothetical protein